MDTDSSATDQLLAENERLRARLVECERERDSLEAVLNAMTDGVLVWDADLRVVRCNDAIREFVGRDITGLGMGKVLDLVDSKAPEGSLPVVDETPAAQVLGGEAVPVARFEMTNAQGERRKLSSSLAPLRAGEQTVGAVAIFHDVTDLENLAAEAARRANLLDAVINATGDGIMVCDLDGNLLQTNEAARRILGYSEEAMRARLGGRYEALRARLPNGEVVDLEDMPAVRALRGETGTGAIMAVRAGDTEDDVWLSASYAPTRDADGEVSGAVISYSDITVIIEAQHEAQERAAELETVVNSITGGGVMVLDGRGSIVRITPGLRELLHYGAEDEVSPVEERVARLGLHSLDGEPMAPEDTPAARALRGERVAGVPLALRVGNREIVTTCSASPLRGSSGEVTGAVLSLTDITELHRLQREREDLLRQVSRERALLRAVVEQMPVGVNLGEAQTGRLLLTNKQHDLIWGGFAPVDSMSGYDVYVGFHPDGSRYEADEGPLARALARGEFVSNETIEILRFDGTRAVTSQSAAPVYDDDGDLIAGVVTIVDVTEERRRQAEREKLLNHIRDERERFFSVLSMLPGYVCLLSPENDVVFANQGFVELFGEPAGRKCHEALFGLAERCPWCHSFDCLETGQPRQGEGTSPQGTVFEIYDHPFADLDGRTLVLEVGIDISERKRQQADLERTTKTLRTLLDTMPGGVTACDATGNVVVVNQPMRRILGGGEHERAGVPAQGMKICGTDGAEYPSAEMPLRLALDRGESTRNVEMIFRRDDGSETFVLVAASPIHDDDGTITGAVSVTLDASELYRARLDLQMQSDHLEALVIDRTAELAERSRLVESVFESSVYSLALLDRGFNFLRVNEAYAEIAHRSKEELLRRNHFELFPSEDLQAAFEEVVRTGQPWHTFSRPTAPNPYDESPHVIYWDLAVVPILDPRGEVEAVLYSLHDVTEREEITEQLVTYRNNLRTLASELALAEERERRRIATGIHDEISQSLALAKMRVEALRSVARNDETYNSLAEIGTMLGQVMQFARDLTFEISPPVLYQLGFDAAMDWLGEQMTGRHGFEVEVEAEPEPRPMSEDTQVVLFQAVRELLNNVGKHAQATEARVTVRRAGDEIEVVVADNGVGFDPSERVGGFGLFDISERLTYLGGRIDVDSTPGQGATFILHAPLEKGEDV